MLFHLNPESALLVSRRSILRAAAGGAGAAQLLRAMELAATQAVSQGPAYRPGAPFRSDLIAPGTAGTRFVLSGQVFSITGKPVAGAVVDLWSVDGTGRYDMDGFNLRGRQSAEDPAARFRFHTIEAVSYSGRTAHFHVKVSAPGFAPLTTELYLQGVPKNSQDGSFHVSRAITPFEDAGVRQGRFDFVLRPV